ncbi:MAG: hypothetical protein M3552_22490, partial [Planctomycetota bacterium]|nr:hypothetical protein [Planctomycetota bacterium]
IYALGCTLYHFVAGTPPFTGKDTLEIILAKEHGRFTSARKRNPEVTERLDLMIDKMLAKDPQHRYAKCEELIRDLSSLRLANASLSFIEDALPTLPGGTVAASSPGQKNPTRASSVKTPTNAKAAAKTSAETAQPWFILHTAVNGQATVSRMTTAQVLKGLQGGIFDPRSTRVKRSEHDEFLPPAQFVEFEAVANSIASRSVAQKRVRSLRADFATFEKQDRWRKRLRPIKSFLSGLGGLIGLILWLGLIAGVIWAAWHWGWDYIRPRVE